MAGAGTRPGLHGQVLLSTGHGKLDALLGGGIPQGSLMLIDSIHLKGSSRALMRLFLGEGVASGHSCSWFTHGKEVDRTKAILPALCKKGNSTSSGSKNRDTEGKSDSLRIAWQYKRYLRADEEQGTSPRSNNSEKSVKRTGGRSGHEAALKGAAREWCHHFDLRGSMDEGSLEAKGNLTVHCLEEIGTLESLLVTCFDVSGSKSQAKVEPHRIHPALGKSEELATSKTQHVVVAPVALDVPKMQSSFKKFGKLSLAEAYTRKRQATRESASEGAMPASKVSGMTHRAVEGHQSTASEVKRIVIEGFGSHEWVITFGKDENTIEEEMLRAMLSLRFIAHSTNSTIWISAPLGIHSEPFAKKIRRFVDVVVALEPLKGDRSFYSSLPDPTSCINLLRVLKLPIKCSLGPVVAPAVGQTYLVRNKRHKLVIEELTTPPDDPPQADDGKSGSAGMFCSLPGRELGSLDF